MWRITISFPPTSIPIITLNSEWPYWSKIQFSILLLCNRISYFADLLLSSFLSKWWWMSNQQPTLGWLSIMKKTEFVDYEIDWTYDLLTISGCFCLIVIIRQRYIHDGIELIFFFCLHVRTYLSIYSYSIKKVQLPIR